jgi:pyrimidine operon attenuation protein/uracil phosphoribosyltransferase
MVKKPKYILIQDTETVFSRIGGKTKTQFNTSFTRAVDNYLAVLRSSLCAAFDSQVDIRIYSQLQVEAALQRQVTDELKANHNTVCICLDRFLLDNLESAGAYQKRFFRFQICRSSDDKKIPRQGSAPFLEQLEHLQQAIPKLDNKQLIIVDDGVFSGGTIKKFLQLLSAKGIKAPIKKVIVFVGNRESLKNFTLVPLEIIKQVNNLYDWVNIRDFSPFGGKILYASKNNKVLYTIPYLYPWSNGASASLDMSPQLFTVSQNMIRAFKDLLIVYESIYSNKPLTFRKLVKNGFSLPTNLERNIPISINDSVIEYLDRCMKLIQKNY